MFAFLNAIVDLTQFVRPSLLASLHIPLQMPLTHILSAIGVILLFAVATYARMGIARSTKKKGASPVLRVAEIYIYPVKSCRGISLSSSTFNRLGFEYDRQWLIVNADNGNMVTAREFPHLARVHVSIDVHASTITLAYENRKPLVLPLTLTDASVLIKDVKVWGGAISAKWYDQRATTWITDVINNPLVKDASSSSSVVAARTYSIATILDVSSHNRPIESEFDCSVPSDRINASFTDGFPFLLASRASLSKVQQWTKANRRQRALDDPSSSATKYTDITMSNFRPNIVFDGGVAWVEDSMREIQIGTNVDNKFYVTKHCSRCILTTVVPDIGVKSTDGEPLISLRQHRKILNQDDKYKNEAYFGQNIMQQLTNGEVKVGDRIRIISKKANLLEYRDTTMGDKSEQAAEQQ